MQDSSIPQNVANEKMILDIADLNGPYLYTFYRLIIANHGCL